MSQKSHAAYKKELAEMLEVVQAYAQRIQIIQSKGVPVDQELKDLIASITTNAQALIAQGSSGVLPPAIKAELVAALTPINDLLHNALTPPAA